jgi:hypothetical protein
MQSAHLSNSFAMRARAQPRQSYHVSRREGEIRERRDKRERERETSSASSLTLHSHTPRVRARAHTHTHTHTHTHAHTHTHINSHPGAHHRPTARTNSLSKRTHVDALSELESELDGLTDAVGDARKYITCEERQLVSVAPCFRGPERALPQLTRAARSVSSDVCVCVCVCVCARVCTYVCVFASERARMWWRFSKPHRNAGTSVCFARRCYAPRLPVSRRCIRPRVRTATS